MEISSVILLYAFYVLLGIFLLFSFINLFHLFRFGLIGFGAVFVGLMYVAFAALIVFRSLDVAHGHEWTESLTLPFGPS